MSGRGPLAGCVAIFAPALGGAVVVSLLSDRFDGGFFLLCVMVGIVLAACHAIFIALPLYMLLLDRWPLRWWSAGLAGFLVGAVPMPLLALASSRSVEALFSGVLWFGGAGLVSGLVFCAVRGEDLVVEDETA